MAKKEPKNKQRFNNVFRNKYDKPENVFFSEIMTNNHYHSKVELIVKEFVWSTTTILFLPPRSNARIAVFQPEG